MVRRVEGAARSGPAIPGEAHARGAALPSRSGQAAAPSVRCAGAVLAGGLSSRMGRPKAWLSFEGIPLLQRVVERLGQVFSEIVVVGAEGQELPETGRLVVRDGRPARGPLGGLEAALGSVSEPALVAVSCDAPFLQPPLARRLAELAADFDVAVPRWGGRLNPLLAAYRTSLRPAVSRLLAEGRLRPAFLFQEVNARVLEEEEVHRLDPAGLSFVNMNSPEEYAAALAAAPPRVTFELFGEPCLLAGRRELAVDVPTPTRLLSALQALARAAPPLVGPVLEEDGRPGSGFLLNLDGREFTQDMDRPLRDGDRVLLLAASAGG
jgi:molybdopterin-guanine dinucleotide biosynthesis protein A